MNPQKSSPSLPAPARTQLVGVKPPKKEHILVVDDEHANVSLLTRVLTKEGYVVTAAANGEEALDHVRASVPDLVLLDILMPVMDGLTVCHKLRSDFSTHSLPIILLTALNSQEDRITGLRAGVDDFISKPFDLEELKVRVSGALQRRRWDQSSQPLTHLPSSPVIEEEVWKRLRAGDPFAFAYIDIDNFKAYNDVYGFDSGDKVIKFLASSLMGAVKSLPQEDAFAGHIGGDDFVFVSSVQNVEVILPELMTAFDAQRVQFYCPEDVKRGGIETTNRSHQIQTFPLMALSGAIVSTATRRILHYGYLVDIVTELKRYVKLQDHFGRSLFMWDRRSNLREAF